MIYVYVFVFLEVEEINSIMVHEFAKIYIYMFTVIQNTQRNNHSSEENKIQEKKHAYCNSIAVSVMHHCHNCIIKGVVDK